MTPRHDQDHDHDQSGPSLDVDRRGFLGLLGGGIAVACAPGGDTVLARPAEDGKPAAWPDRNKRSPREVAAWLHIGADGMVSAYTGKVEIGQNIRTSLAQAIAEELRTPFAMVRMVMGDTARTPFDIGTFGSLTTSANAPLLRRAAATLREILAGRAAMALGVERAALVVADGKITHPPTGRILDFATLARGDEFPDRVADQAALTPAADWRVAGRAEAKVDGRAFVTGAHRYPSDIKRPGLWVGKTLRPPSYRAALASVDTTAAEAMPGVVVVREGEFVGVAAADEATAAQALSRIKATWNPGPATCSSELLPEYLRAHARGYRGLKPQPSATANEVAITAAFTAAFIAHVPLEPRAAVAEWDGDRLTVWTGSQRPFAVRTDLARAFGLPEDQVRVFVPDTGSGYGGKHIPDADIEATRLARAAGRPVRRVWSREEEFRHAYARPGGVVDAAARARRDGTLTAWEFHNINAGNAGLNPPYTVPGPVVGFHASDPPLRQGSYRALASTFNHFARESLINELAVALALDPLALRLRNLTDDRLIAVLKAAADRFGWNGGQAPGPGRGVGIAGGHDKGSCIATCAEVAADAEKKTIHVRRVVAAFEPGAVVNPDGMRNQVEGALMMGLGGALFEELTFADGALTNGRLARYRVPRITDLPTIEVVLLDREDLPPAGGGEIPIVAIAPAIAAAVFQAIGQRLRSLPMKPDGWTF